MVIFPNSLTPSSFTLTFPESGCLFLSFLSMSLPRTLQLHETDSRNCGFQKGRGQGLGFFFPRGSLVLLQICLLPPLATSPADQEVWYMGNSRLWGPHNVCFPSPRGSAACLTYICPSRDLSMNSGLLCPSVVIQVAGDIFNFLHSGHPKQVSLVSALKQLPLSCGRDLIKWKHQFFLLSHSSAALCKVEVFCSLEHRGYEEMLWPIHFGDEWCCHRGSRVIRASPVTGSMRWTSASGIAPESPSSKP